MLEDHHLYKAAIEHSPIGIGLCAPEGRFLDVNRALCALTGHEAQTLRTRGLFDLCHPDHTERARDSVEALLSGQREALSISQCQILFRVSCAFLNYGFAPDARLSPRQSPDWAETATITA